MPFVNYHRHSHYSNIILPDSVATNEDYCKRIKELDQTILSSCEHGTPGNYRQCADLAEKYGLHWRYVAEAYFVLDRHEKDKTNCHLILAAKTAKGIGDLNEVLSEANLTGYYYRPRLDMELLMTLDPRDVFVTTACVGGVWQYGYSDGRYDFTEPDRIVKTMAAHFGNSFMLEIQYHHTEKQKELNRHILQLYRDTGIPLIVGLDSHYIGAEDGKLRDQLLESHHLHYEEEDGWFMDYPDDQTILSRFMGQGVFSKAQVEEAMRNTQIFETFEDVVFDKGKKLPTIYPALSQDERNEKYRSLIREKWLEYRKTVPQEKWSTYEQGIAYEVNTITSTNTSDYFLLDYEIVKRFKELGGRLTYTGRGSAPSYFTNTLLGFSSIDRFALPITMYPDRFISADRLKAGSLPDIDMNVADPDIFAEAQAQVMGKWHSAPMIAYGTLKRLSAWKMYCRASSVPFEVANKISDDLKQYELDLKHADDDEKDTIDPFNYVPKAYHEQLRMSEKYLGMVDSISPHPCAYVVFNGDVRREFGIFRLTAKTGKKKEVYAAFVDGATADGYGYLKNDDLKVDVVAVNADIYKRIGMPQPTVPELLKLIENDKPTWDMYAKGLTMGLNQAEKEKSTQKVMTYKPRNISEMSAFVAGIRPAFQSMLSKFLNREHFRYGIPALDKLLQTKELPESFILYQEQMMTVLQYAGFTAPESYASIKAIAKKHPEKVKPLKERFLKGFADRLIHEEHTPESTAKETADKVWVIISDACGYGFNSCLAGDETILRDSNGKFVPTIAEMYHICNDAQYAKKTKHWDLHKKYRALGYGKAYSLMDDDRLHKNRIVDIRYQGVRDVYRLTTASGKEVLATDNHKFPIGSYDNLVYLRDLKIGDSLFCSAGYEKCLKQYHFTDGHYVPNIPHKGQMGFQKNPDGDSVVYLRERSKHASQKESCECCHRAYSNDARFELHHKDGNRTNNTPENYEWLCAACHKKRHYQELGRVKKNQKGYPVILDPIISIEQCGQTEVYDVEMEHPYHNFLLSSGIVTGNSHATSVALDSLYTAWAKAHYPFETYVSLLSNYAAKGDKDRIDMIKQEMKRGFDITIAPCKFGQDNRSYYINKERRTISDSLTSIKGVGKKDAEALYRLGKKQYDTFVDLLVDLTNLQGAVNTSVIDTLIKADYFSSFGTSGKLLTICKQFTEGKNRYTKTLAPATVEKRLTALRAFEHDAPEEEIPLLDLIPFEIEKFGTPIHRCQEKDLYAVLEVDTKYSPKLKLYSLCTGNVGTMKVLKTTYNRRPFSTGNVIRITAWQKKPAYEYSDGKPKPKQGVTELWLTDYTILQKGSTL